MKIRRITCSLSFGDQGFSKAEGLEGRGGLEVEPFLSRKGVNDLLLTTLFTLGKTLVLAYSHDKNS